MTGKTPLSFGEMQQVLDGLAKVTGQTGNGAAHVNIEAGGIGVWIATSACVIMLACGFVGALWMFSELHDLKADIAKLEANDQQHADYLAAIYMQAPQLKPEKKED